MNSRPRAQALRLGLKSKCLHLRRNSSGAAVFTMQIEQSRSVPRLWARHPLSCIVVMRAHIPATCETGRSERRASSCALERCINTSLVCEMYRPHAPPIDNGRAQVSLAARGAAGCHDGSGPVSLVKLPYCGASPMSAYYRPGHGARYDCDLPRQLWSNIC
eukprot:6207921-Pleurochrysis_carterae.AAC.3